MNTTLIPWINERIKIMENFFALWIYSSVLDRGEGEGKSIRRLNLTIENVARSRRKRSTKSTTRFSLLVRFANWELNSFVRRWNVCTRRRGRGRDRREKLCVNARDEGSGAASWKLEEAFTFRLRKKKIKKETMNRPLLIHRRQKGVRIAFNVSLFEEEEKEEEESNL